MSNVRNCVQLIGHLGAAPEVKQLETGKVARMRIATNENYKTQSGEWKTNTNWHTVVGWNQLAERMQQHLNKGAYILVEGKLSNREYTTATNEKRYVTEVVMSNFLILDKKAADEDPLPADSQAPNDDLPF